MNHTADHGIRFGRIAAMLPVKDIVKAHAAHFNVAHMMFDDADALHAVCQRYGLRIIKSIQDKDYGLRAFVFEDPDGNRIDVGQPV
jgi:catechol 2,3-dioxygenase-like lactoylglutathione lyase family enzyme